MTSPMTLNQEMEMIRGFDVAEVGIGFIDRWANAAYAAPRHSGSAPSQSTLSRPSGECRLSQGEKK